MDSMISSLCSDYQHDAIPLFIGFDDNRHIFTVDLTTLPHLFIGGASGSGKSVFLRTALTGLIGAREPLNLRLLLIDPKVVELAEYNGIPHLLIPVVTEPRQAAKALGYAVNMVEQRYHLLARNGVRDIRSYNKLAIHSHGEIENLPYIVIAIDGLSELMEKTDNETIGLLSSLAGRGRSVGLHLMITNQTARSNKVLSELKSLLPGRVCFMTTNKADSLGDFGFAGAENLRNAGDLLYKGIGIGKPLALTSLLPQECDISKLLMMLKSQNDIQYNDSVLEDMDKIQLSGAAAAVDEEESDGSLLQDETFVNAVEMALESGNISTSLLQRRLRLGYARAGRLVDEMERMHIISGPNGSKPREVLITRQQWQEMSMNAGD